MDTVNINKTSCTLSLIEENDPDEEIGYKRMMERDERRFKMADENKDMKATKEEFTAFLHPEEYDHMKDIIVMVINVLHLYAFNALKGPNSVHILRLCFRFRLIAMQVIISFINR